MNVLGKNTKRPVAQTRILDFSVAAFGRLSELMWAVPGCCGALVGVWEAMRPKSDPHAAVIEGNQKQHLMTGNEKSKSLGTIF